MPLLIADVSNNQGHLPPVVHAIKHAGFTGVIFKLSEGTGFVDGEAAAGIDVARRLGLVVGGYAFFHPRVDAAAQARVFCDAARTAGLWRKGDIRPVLDYEIDADGHESAHRDAFYRAVQAETGHFSMLYTGGYFAPGGWVRPRPHFRSLWVAGYPSYTQPGGMPRPWLHQFTDRYPVGAYRVDASVVLGPAPRARLRANLCKANNR